MEQQENNPPGMLGELKKFKEEIKQQVKGELPKGAAPVDGNAEDNVTVDAVEPNESAVSAEKVNEEPKEEPVVINGKEFSSTKEALKYAEQLEQEKLIAEARNMGVQDALAYQQAQMPKQPEPEDNFDERFYANPKETLRAYKEEAKNEALALIRAEQHKESMWNQFLNENPGIRRKDAERVLTENMESIGKMTDVPRAMKMLAQKVRAEYDEIEMMRKPRVELNSRGGQAVSSGSGHSGNVTVQKKEDRPLTLTEQMRQLRGQG